MDGKLGSGPRITLLSLVPDAGHVLPLVRIGRALEGAGAVVTMICPSEAEHLAEGYIRSVLSFGSVRPEGYREALARVASSTTTTRRLWVNRWFEKKYAEPVQEAVLQQLDEISRMVSQTAPEVIVADDHLFRSVCQWLAQKSGSPLVLNYSAGSNYRFIVRKPWVDRHPLKEMALSVASRTVAKLLRWGSRIFTPSQYMEEVARLLFLEQGWQRIGSELRGSLDAVPYIACGLIEMENRYLRHEVEVRREMLAFPTVPPIEDKAMPTELMDWLEDGGPVVYISFGTMAPRQFGFSRRLLGACVKQGFRVLWASPADPLSGTDFDPRLVRWEPWVPQVSILSHALIHGFVTHGGAGSIQEALWFGKPVICIPLTWDQPYNAWVAKLLGFGCELPKHRLSAEQIESALSSLREDGPLAAKAVALSSEMRGSADSGALVEFLFSMSEQPADGEQHYRDRPNANGLATFSSLTKHYST